MSGLEEHVAVITGASSGIGKAIALRLASHGAALCLVGRNREALEEVAGTAAAAASQVKCVTVDLVAEHDIRTLGTVLQREYGEIDILIHSAGYISMGLLERTPVEELDRHYRINVRAPYLLTQLVVPLMRPQRGQIVFVNSSIVQHARAGTSQYAASKYALQAIADSLRAEVNDRGIRVLSVYPGRTATPMQAAVHAMEGRPYEPERFIQPEDVAAVVAHALLLERTVEATDIAIRPLRKPS